MTAPRSWRPSKAALARALPAMRRWTLLCAVATLCAPALLFTFDLCFGIGQRVPAMPWRSGLGWEQWRLIFFAPLALTAWGGFFWLSSRWARALPRRPAWTLCVMASAFGALACLGLQAFLAVGATFPAWALMLGAVARPPRPRPAKALIQ